LDSSNNLLAKFHNCPIETTHSARNFGIFFDQHLTFSDQMSSLSKSYYSHIRVILYIRPYLDFTTAISIVQYCHIYRSLQTWLLQLTIGLL